jgi:hypothetical protein
MTIKELIQSLLKEDINIEIEKVEIVWSEGDDTTTYSYNREQS